MLYYMEGSCETRRDARTKTVRVAAAVICDARERPTRVFATARGYGEFRGRWEFPGGKIEPGELAPPSTRLSKRRL